MWMEGAMGDPTDDIVRETSPESRRRAGEANYVQANAILVNLLGGSVEASDDLTLVITGLPIAGFNGVSRATLTEATADARIAAVLARLRERGVPGTWWVSPFSRPADLEQRLLAHGFAGPSEAPAMSLDLGALSAELGPCPAGVTIERVRDAALLRAWTEASAEGFDAPPVMTERLAAGVVKLDHGEQAPTRFYLARDGGVPVATAALVLAAGVAGIYNIATVPHARRRGIGAAITVAPLREARALGYRLAILRATAMGAPVYRRLGFQEDFAYHDYTWQPG
jgi:GNAT superfamily N-acetyltransferase